MSFPRIRIVIVRAFLTAAVATAASRMPAQAEEARPSRAQALVFGLKSRQGEIELHDGLATVRVPEGFHFLDGPDANTVLVKLWGNPPQLNPLGMLLPADVSPLSEESRAVIVTYEENDVSLSLGAGELVSIVGPSGRGKSTLLRMIAGPVARGVLREKRADLEKFMRLVGLESFANSFPHHLSGGMAQRVALTRMRMQDEVLRLRQALGTTMLFVTHDIDEAIYMSDRIVIMTQRPGKIEQIIPVELDRPRDRSSEEFLGLRGDILETLHFAGQPQAGNKS